MRIRKNIFTVRVARHWIRVGSPSVEILQTGLDMALSNPMSFLS